ncbi:uncharacterized protein LOC104849975 [Fukomys damarensis]|uniref:uncharacterized protein LOC104849975 n=1 Tax=Fukomys damarensis TaxID=885580 RepID=UPI00054012E3|nr:uncharacterized protein LOC104849975 [Fukomys damarensis]
MDTSTHGFVRSKAQKHFGDSSHPTIVVCLSSEWNRGKSRSEAESSRSFPGFRSRRECGVAQRQTKCLGKHAPACHTWDTGTAGGPPGGEAGAEAPLFPGQRTADSVWQPRCQAPPGPCAHTCWPRALPHGQLRNRADVPLCGAEGCTTHVLHTRHVAPTPPAWPPWAAAVLLPSQAFAPTCDAAEGRVLIAPAGPSPASTLALSFPMVGGPAPWWSPRLLCPGLAPEPRSAAPQ